MSLTSRFPKGALVRATVESGGDEGTGTPAFLVGDQFTVVDVFEESGWIEVKSTTNPSQEGYISPLWVEVVSQNSNAGPSLGAFPSPSKIPLNDDLKSNDSMVEFMREGSFIAIEVKIARGKDKLGLQIVGGSEYGTDGVFIKTVKPEGAAFFDGRLQKGDKIVKIDGVDFSKGTHSEVVKALSEAGSDVSLVVQRKNRKIRDRRTLLSCSSLCETEDEGSSGSDIEIDEHTTPSMMHLPTPTPSPSSSSSSSPKPRPVSMLEQGSKTSLKMETRKAGWLLKQGGGKRELGDKSIFSLKNWKKRYFVLQDTILKYYKTSNIGSEEAMGYVNLTPTTRVLHQKDKSFMIITNKRTYYCIADSPDDAAHWVQVLTNVCLRSNEETKRPS